MSKQRKDPFKSLVCFIDLQLQWEEIDFNLRKYSQTQKFEEKICHLITSFIKNVNKFQFCWILDNKIVQNWRLFNSMPLKSSKTKFLSLENFYVECLRFGIMQNQDLNTFDASIFSKFDFSMWFNLSIYNSDIKFC